MHLEQSPTDKKGPGRVLVTSCSVCGEEASSHLHYGAVSCYSCRAFFRRGIGREYKCVEGNGSCIVDTVTRKSCQKCRFTKCLSSGMRVSKVEEPTGRRRRTISGKEGKDGKEGKPGKDQETKSKEKESTAAGKENTITSFNLEDDGDILHQVLQGIGYIPPGGVLASQDNSWRGSGWSNSNNNNQQQQQQQTQLSTGRWRHNSVDSIPAGGTGWDQQRDFNPSEDFLASMGWDTSGQTQLVWDSNNGSNMNNGTHQITGSNGTQICSGSNTGFSPCWEDQQTSNTLTVQDKIRVSASSNNLPGFDEVASLFGPKVRILSPMRARNESSNSSVGYSDGFSDTSSSVFTPDNSSLTGSNTSSRCYSFDSFDTSFPGSDTRSGSLESENFITIDTFDISPVEIVSTDQETGSICISIPLAANSTTCHLTDNSPTEDMQVVQQSFSAHLAAPARTTKHCPAEQQVNIEDLVDQCFREQNSK